MSIAHPIQKLVATETTPTPSARDRPALAPTPPGDTEQDNKSVGGSAGPSDSTPDSNCDDGDNVMPHTESDGVPPTPSADLDFRQLVAEANEGDTHARQRLREALDSHPEIWRRMGDLAAHARMTLIRSAASGDQLLLESLLRTAASMEKDLLKSGASPLERLAVSRVVSTWLQAQHADAMAAASLESLPWAKFWAQQQDRAHRRQVAAVKQLTVVRQLLPRDGEGDQEPPVHDYPTSQPEHSVEHPQPILPFSGTQSNVERHQAD